ncbi:MAG: 4-alpha-glucanotransferase [Dermatophilaceae bacterium]
MATPSPRLVELAHAHGVATEYWDWCGHHIAVSAATIRAVLGALGVPTADDATVEQALSDVADASWRRTLPASLVVREGCSSWVPAHVPAGTGIRLTVECEDGTSREVAQVDRVVPDRFVDGAAVGEATFEVPGTLPLGWHRLIAHPEVPATDPSSTVTTLVVTPQRLALPAALEAGRVVGLAAQLYQVRSTESWGMGDLGDLADLATWAASDHHADFVLVNPLHAGEPSTPLEPSPYLPTTRRFVSPLYLTVSTIDEVANLPVAQADAVARLANDARVADATDRIDRDAVWTAKKAALQMVFEVPRSPERERSFAEFCEREGEGLQRFATWCVLAERRGLPFADWPEALRDPASPAVAAVREERRDEVDFHRWLQWQLDEQLSEAQRRARAAGMALGVVHDLAVGVHPGGADAWALGPALARGVTVGAPPDQFNQLGQDWSQPPWRPDGLAALGYAPFRDMVRAVLRDSGGVRVDHIIGLFRLWWIPVGCSPAEGTYVRYDHEALLGILVLEAQRAGAVVIGEDLGVVEPSAREYLTERGLFGTSILWFEWDADRPKQPEHYRDLCLSSVTTHDLPPSAGYLALDHVAVRERLGLLTRTAAEERAVEEMAIARVRGELEARGLVEVGADTESVLIGLHRWLGQTPSRMLAVALPDLVGDRRAINQPGTHDEYPNWRLPLTGPDGVPVTLDGIRAAGFAGVLFDALRGDDA